MRQHYSQPETLFNLHGAVFPEDPKLRQKREEAVRWMEAKLPAGTILAPRTKEPKCA